MKYFAVLLLPFFIGCSGGSGEFAAGAAAGGALTGALAVYQQHQQDLAARYEQALKEQEQAVTLTEQQAAKLKAEALQKELQETQKKVILLETAKTAVDSSASVDWTGPQAVSGFTTAASVLLASYLLSRKKSKSWRRR
ncbi:MAG TPA: hypothetical protein PKY88_12570 [Anaerohalosphaeraceae bacterium]|nr:hypothetical protein [Anaerohalosphaeraceae bacterium]